MRKGTGGLNQFDYSITGDTIHYDLWLDELLTKLGIDKNKLSNGVTYTLWLAYVMPSKEYSLQYTSEYFASTVNNGAISIITNPSAIRSDTNDGTVRIVLMVD